MHKRTEYGALTRPSLSAASLSVEDPGLRNGEPCEIVAGLYGLRLELPFVLDHVNIWLCAERDGWTVITRDRQLSAQFEHTVGVTQHGREVFTISPAGKHHPAW